MGDSAVDQREKRRMSITTRICLIILAASTLLASATPEDAAAGRRDAVGLRRCPAIMG